MKRKTFVVISTLFVLLLVGAILLAQYPVPATIGDLNPSKPLDTDPVSQGAAAIRQIKAAVIQSFGVSFYEGGPLDGMLKTGAVTVVNLGTGSVGNAQIANGSITFSKLASELSLVNRILISVPNSNPFSNTTALTSLFTAGSPPVVATNILANGVIRIEANVVFINGTAADHRFSYLLYTNGFPTLLGASNIFVSSHSRLLQPLLYVNGITTQASQAATSYYISPTGMTNDVFGSIDSADPNLLMQIVSTTISSYGGP